MLFRVRTLSPPGEHCIVTLYIIHCIVTLSRDRNRDKHRPVMGDLAHMQTLHPLPSSRFASFSDR